MTGHQSLALASRPVSSTAAVFAEGKARAQSPGSPFGGVGDLVSHPYGFLSLLLIFPFLGQGHGFGFGGLEPNGVIVGPAQAGAPACGRPRRFFPPPTTQAATSTNETPREPSTWSSAALPISAMYTRRTGEIVVPWESLVVASWTLLSCPSSSIMAFRSLSFHQGPCFTILAGGSIGRQ